ncbi:MAG: hypothetical protein IT435_04500 [Phycisphaerales bacterium]|nr:hypothetical protein [Phycisphaerales bacterium]
MSINRRVRFDGGIINGSPALTVLHQRGMPGQYSYDETGTQVSGPRYARRKLPTPVCIVLTSHAAA